MREIGRRVRHWQSGTMVLRCATASGLLNTRNAVDAICDNLSLCGRIHGSLGNPFSRKRASMS